MGNSKTQNFYREIVWLLLIIVGALIVEFSILYVFDLHPVFRIKMQGFIGLLILGYGIRVGSKIWMVLHQPADPATNGKHEVD